MWSHAIRLDAVKVCKGLVQHRRIAPSGLCDSDKVIKKRISYAFHSLTQTAIRLPSLRMRTLIKRGSDDTISEGDCIDPRGLGTQLA